MFSWLFKSIPANKFKISIPKREEYPIILQTQPTNQIQCYTDGSKTPDGVGAGVNIEENPITGRTIQISINMGPESTVFQSEVTAVGKAADILLDKNITDATVKILSDSQATIKALQKTKIKSRMCSNLSSNLLP